MNKIFEFVRPGDDIYLVCKDKETKLFKIRVVKVTETLYVGEKIGVKCGPLEFEADPNRTYAYHKHINTFIKGFTNKEEAQEDYKLRIMGEISDLSVRATRLNETIYRATVLLRNAKRYRSYKGLK